MYSLKICGWTIFLQFRNVNYRIVRFEISESLVANATFEYLSYYPFAFLFFFYVNVKSLLPICCEGRIRSTVTLGARFLLPSP